MSNKQQFEAWMTDEQWFHGSDFEWDERRNRYSQFGIHLAYKAWQAASKASEQQLAAVVAENAALKQKGLEVLNEACRVYEKFNETINPETGDFMDGQTLHEFQFLLDAETPETDAILNEVRAEGVEMFARNAEGAEQGNGLMKAIARRAIKFAVQLRQGAKS